MILDERLRWMGFWMLDKMKGGKTREYYDQIRYAWKEGSSVEETEKRIQNLIAHAVKTTDFYKDYPETCSLEDLPVVNKDTFRQQYDRFVSSTYKDAPDNRVMCTSGSTGTPLRMIQNRDKIRHNTAGGIFLGAAAGYYIGMKEAFIRVEDGEMYIYGMHISPYEKGNIFNKDPLRVRKLLLHKKEILKIFGKMKEQGITVVPLQVYFSGSLVKIEIGLAKGKKLYDKRETIAKKDQKREAQREFKAFNR